MFLESRRDICPIHVQLPRPQVPDGSRGGKCREEESGRREVFTYFTQVEVSTLYYNTSDGVHSKFASSKLLTKCT